MGKNVAVFVDVANIFYAAKAAGVDIDYVTLLKASSAGRDLVRAYAYTGLDPDNENQRNFHDFLRRHGYKVVSKDIRKYGDGKVKANLDIELVVDMMKTARNLDVAIVVSGDGDFAPAIRAVQEMGVRVEVVSFRGNTSSDLMDVADQFSDITQIAKVEKGSSRSGRRVAGDDADLSMTEVPDKQSEGTGERGRGRGRARRTSEPVGVISRGRSRAAATGEPALLVLPGEKLSRAAAAVSPDGAEQAAARAEDAESEIAIAEGSEPQAGETDLAPGEDATPRRRRRRGGRGRGRGRGRDEGYGDEAEPGEVRSPAAEEPDEELVAAPARPRPTSTFGSVWDSQIGIPTAARTAGGPTSTPEDDEDLEEPAIPEYLLAERRRQGSRQGRGGRGRGGAYAAALDRERFGGGRGSTISRFAEPSRREPSGPRREPSGPRREANGPRREPAPTRGGRPERRAHGDEPWSEVPPEIEAMLRAQLGSSSGGPSRPRPEPQPAPAEAAAPEEATTAEGEPEAKPTTRRRTTRTTRAADESAVPAAAEGEPDAKPTTRRRTTRTSKTASADAVTVEASEAKPKRTTRTRTKAAADTADTTVVAADVEAATSGEPAPTPTRRRTTRKKAEPTA